MKNDRRLMQFYFITEGEKSTHYHQNPELFYVLAGELTASIDDQIFRMKQGDILLINANKHHMMDGNQDVLAARFEIDFHLLAEHMGTMQLLFWCNTLVDKNAAYQQLRNYLDQIMLRYFEKDEKNELHLNALYYECLHLLTGNFLVKMDDARFHIESSQDKQRISQIQNYVQANYQSQISLNDLADRLFLSNAYLSKYIKKNLSLTFMEYLNNVRLFHAVDELLYTQKNMTHIALDNGFPTSAAFTKAFKDVYGEAPSEYRKRLQYQEMSGEPDRDVTERELKRIQKYLELKAKKKEPETKNMQIYQIDTLQPGTRLSNGFRTVCIGEAYQILHSDVQNQIRELKSETDILYARIWNIFSREECVSESGKCNFRKIDMVLDFLVENHIKPYLELGHKETAFMYSPERVLKEYEKIGHYSKELFEGIMQAFGTHLVNRYGIEEIETWYFEYWNNNLYEMEKEDGQYYHYFETVFRVLKEISSQIRVGGAGFILGYDTVPCLEILKIWKQRKYQPDFLSVYSYQYTAAMEAGKRYGRKSIDVDYMKNQVAIMKNVIRDVGIEVKELHITEWNFTISNRNQINDSCEQGAYVLKNCIDMNGEVDLMSYWHALDSYSDYYDTNDILNGDSGLISRDGIYKPAFHAFAFMKRLQPDVIKKEEYAIVTTNGRGHFTIACHNFKQLSAHYVFKDEEQIALEEIDSYTGNAEPLKLKFALNHVKNGTYQVKIYYVNRENGSAQDIWKRLEYGKNLTKDEMNYLRKSAIPRIEMHSISVENETLELENILMEQEIRLLDIRYQYTVQQE